MKHTTPNPQQVPPPVAVMSSSRISTEAARRVQSAELFGPGREVLIEHDGFVYRLRLTQSNKLILTK